MLPLRMRAALLLCLVSTPLCFGCGESIDLGSYLVWSATHETGDTSEWEALAESGSTVILTAVVSSEQAHSGSYSLALSSADPPGFAAGFDFNPVIEAYFSGWFYLAAGYDADTPWPLLNFTSRGDGCTGPDGTCAGVDVRVRTLPTGQVLLYLFNAEPDVLQPPLSDPPAYVPVGRWFQLEARFKRATDHSGLFHLWLDGQPLFRFGGWRTAEFDNLFWGIANPPTGEGGAEQAAFVDDAAISLIAVTPTGELD